MESMSPHAQSTERMERCRRFRYLISVSSDEQVSDLEDAALRRHLRTCTECRGFARVVDEMKWAASDPQPIPPCPQLGEDLAAAVTTARMAWRRSWWGRALRPALSGALAVTTLVVLLGWWGHVGMSPAAAPSSSARNAVAAAPDLMLPQKLDPSYVPYLKQKRSLLAATYKDPSGTWNERLMYRETPMSWYDEVHYRP
jgi:predicted anti-sigma-YlaC factor YlaD